MEHFGPLSAVQLVVQFRLAAPIPEWVVSLGFKVRFSDEALTELIVQLSNVVVGSERRREYKPKIAGRNRRCAHGGMRGWCWFTKATSPWDDAELAATGRWPSAA